MPDGWPLEIATSVLLSMASTKPSPRVLSELRNVRTSLPPKTRSVMEASTARSLMSEPPGWSTKFVPSKWPARSSVTWLIAPVTGF